MGLDEKKARVRTRAFGALLVGSLEPASTTPLAFLVHKLVYYSFATGGWGSLWMVDLKDYWPDP